MSIAKRPLALICGRAGVRWRGEACLPDSDCMDMVLAMLMAYVWAGAVWPHIVRNRQLFALGFAAVLAAMLLGTLRLTFFAHVLELGAFVTLVGSAAGAINPLWRDLRFR